MRYDDKQFRTLQARAAFKGALLELIEADDGSCEFIATAGPRTRRMASLCEVADWLEHVEAGITCLSTEEQF